MPRLVIEKGPDKGRYVVVTQKTTVVVGRDTSAAIPLHDTMASRVHFKIEQREDAYYLLDMESMNGTLLNGQPVKESKLSYGDLIKVGETLFSFVSDDAPPGGLTGQKLGGYRILERIGRGGMGTVYKAEQIDLQRLVALKVLSEENANDRDFIDLFVHEARAAAKLNHPNIVQVYDVKRHGNLYFFSMEFVANGSVQELLNKARKLPVDQTLTMILESARGLDYAHGKGIVHRDIKPDNLMVSEDGKIKIGDLGLARRLDEKVGPSEENAVIGTPHYIAPEQVLGKPADYRSDIYALGSTFYRMLAGITPYSAASVRDLVNKKVREDPQALHDVNAEVPRKVSDIVHKMMARDPAVRYQTMAEVAGDVEKAKREIAGVPAEEGQTTGPIAVGNRRLLIAAVLLLMVVVVGVAAFTVVRYATKKEEPSNPGTNVEESDDLPSRMLVNAKAFELSMDKNDPESIRRGIKEFGAIVEKYAVSSDGKIKKIVGEARDLKGRLETMLRECQASLDLAGKCETEDIQNWLKMKREFDNDKLDLKAIDQTIQIYHDFANHETYRGTAAADAAKEREEHILAWKTEIEKWKKEYNAVLADVDGLESQNKYRDAWFALNDFENRVAGAKMKCDFANDRYHVLLFDYKAGERRKKLVKKAETEYYAIETECKKIQEDRAKSEEKYTTALGKLQRVVDSSLEDLSTSATLVRRTLEEDRARWRKEEEDRADKVRRDQLNAERQLFEKASREANAQVVKFRFKEALVAMRAVEGKIVLEPYAPRVTSRLDELQKALTLREEIETAFKAGRFKKAFKWPKLQIDGTITEFTDAGFKITLSSGWYEFRFTEFTPAEFYAWVKSSWTKISPENLVCLVIVCMEFGLYEEALKELDALLLLDAVKNNAPLKAFCEKYKQMIADGEYTEFEEIEAQKRVVRLRTFVKESKLKEAKDEIDILRRKYGRTNAFKAAQQEIDEAIQKINSESGAEDKKNMKSKALNTIEKYKSNVRNEATKRKDQDIIPRLNRIDDLFERNWYLGEMYAAHGEWLKSTERWAEAKKLGDRAANNREARDYLYWLGYVYAGLIRNGIVRGDGGFVKQIRAEAGKRFIEEKKQAPMAWWIEMDQHLVSWQERYAGSQKRLDAQLKEFREDPEDPHRIWQVATTLYQDQANLIEARGYLEYLLDNHPTFEHVQSGECLYRIAEIRYQFKEIPESLAAFKQLREEYPSHPSVKGGGDDESSVKRRMELCYQLAEKMGYTKERPGKDRERNKEDKDK